MIGRNCMNKNTSDTSYYNIQRDPTFKNIDELRMSS